VALLERLQILIDADAKGAVREFDKAGAAADKLDAKLEKGSAKTSARLQSIGSRTAIGGAVVIGGLFKLAQASDEAEIQQTKLENSIRNSDQTFKNSGKGLTDLATGLQQVTAADGDAIVGAESLLVQMGLTEEQVKTVTPLVVDLSRKLGIDLDTAAKMVGKSIGGSAGALKKAGIEVDGARLKTDAFSATVDALAGSVGGFARQEGLTFAGQIAILKNNLGDLGESVGKGAAGVFGALAGDAAKAAGALNKINPAILETVGAVGATGSLAATLAGGFAFAAGKAIDFKNQVQAGNTALVKVGDDGVKSLTKVGKAASAIAGVAIVVGIIETVATISNSINQIEKKGTAAFDGFRGAINGTSADLADAFAKLVEVEDKSAEFAGIWEGFGAEIQLGDFKADVEEVQAAFNKVLDTFGPEAAQKTIDGLRKQNEALDKNSDQYRTNADFIAENQQVINKRRTALTQATVAEREQKKATQEAVEQYDRQTASVESVVQTIKDYNDNLTLLTAEYDAAQAGAKAFGDQVERATSVDNIAGAVTRLGGAVRTLNADLAALPSFEVALDPTRISEDAGKAVDSLIQFGGAAQTYFQQVIGAGGADLVPALAEKYRTILTTALQNAGVNPADIPNFIQLAGLDDESITVAVKFAKDQASLDRLKLELELFSTELSNDPAATAFIKAAIAQGNFEGAQKFFEIWAQNNPINVPVIPTPGTGGSYTVTVTPGVNSSGGTSGNQRTPRGRRVGAPSSEAPSPPSASLPPGRALGGPLAKGQMSYVNEMGAEMFVPTSSGFVMDSDDSKALVRGVEAMLAGGGGSTINVYETASPRQTATEVVRKQRDAAYLIGR
jgi:hypothetical protein